MTSDRLSGLAVPASFAVLCGVLAGVAGVSAREGVAAALAVALSYGVSGLVAPSGWRRRAAELALLPPAFALTLLADPTQRAMVLPPLLTLAAMAAFLAARRRVTPALEPLLAATLAASLVAATSPGLAGFPFPLVALAVLAPPVLALAAARLAGLDAGLVVALLSGALPLVRAPLVAVLAVTAAVSALVWLRPAPAHALRRLRRTAVAWLPAALGLALVASALAPWGLPDLSLLFPHASAWSLLALTLALAITPFLPPAASGAAWLLVSLTLGPPQLAPADRPGTQLTASSPSIELPPGTGAPYLLDLALANAGDLPAGTLVATLAIGDYERPVLAGTDTTEWAARRPGARTAHPLPAHPVLRPAEAGARAFWAAGGRISLEVEPGLVPRLTRTPELPARAVLAVSQAGPSRPTPPRDWPLPTFLLASALAVATLQIASRSLASHSASLPWALLLAGSLAARLPLEPLHLLAERHAVDLALAPFLAAFLPAAQRWLRLNHPFLTASALLLPLALATPHLANTIGDGSYQLLLTQSLTLDGDFNLGNNYDLEHHPNQRIYVPFTGTFIHSPVLATLLAPGYLVAGRGGALAELALAGAALVALVWRRARTLGVGERRLGLLVMALLLSYPLISFVCEMWTELAGALLLAVAVVAAAHPTRGRVVAPLATLLGIAVKTRFGLLLVPQVAAAYWPARWRRREVVLAVAALGLTTVVALGAATLIVTHPLDPLGRRSLSHLMAATPLQALRVLAGLSFDVAGGLLWSAPLALAALAGLGALWRRGGQGEKAMLVGALLTLAAILHMVEWRGGDSPPARYLVPLLPLLALAGAMLLSLPRRWRPWLAVLVPPTVVVSWVAFTRPFLLINTGDGSFWLGSALARRLGADVTHLFPSLLRVTPGSFVVPLVVAALAALALLATRRHARPAREGRRLAVSLWLLAGAALLLTATLRPSTVVELEDPQVRREGGVLEPPVGAWSRFRRANGWRIAEGDAVVVPLRLPERAGVTLHGWLDGPARAGATLEVTWDGRPTLDVVVAGAARSALTLPATPGPGRHTLRLALCASSGGTAVLDRIVVQRQR